jgi:hypothetical protein
MKKLAIILSLITCPAFVSRVQASADITWPESDLDSAPVDPGHKPKTYNRVQIAFLAIGARLYLCYHIVGKKMARAWHCMWCTKKASVR